MASPALPDFTLQKALTRRRFLGLSLGASAAAAAATLGLPAIVGAVTPSGLTAARRADCLALAETLAEPTGMAASGLSPTAAVVALDQAYAAGDPHYRAQVDVLIDALETPRGARYGTLATAARKAFLRAELSPAARPDGRGGLITHAVCLVGEPLVAPAPGWRDPGAFAHALAGGTA